MWPFLGIPEEALPVFHSHNQKELPRVDRGANC